MLHFYINTVKCISLCDFLVMNRVYFSLYIEKENDEKRVTKPFQMTQKNNNKTKRNEEKRKITQFSNEQKC